ncbi:MAG TPA: MGMT family protein [Mobilitalea sp.]|nr:MGMT family protein [Mobilitalea sp.]
MNINNKKFFEKVYDIVANIPEGQVATYGQIAQMAGSQYAARIVGYAMNRAPEERNLPCHRVVNKEGHMAPGNVFGGQDVQRSVLEKEGITFLENGCINMEKHLWRFYV